ncbi:hypothetical protein AUJ14_04565 [Candidatus Micrarchaeota archaeon CG1_02_55_22]|nr:MAG: hypothetical protein AUJ14_04565 [Candidatus Micrarchaeota archaeon CG1_02_55_22]
MPQLPDAIFRRRLDAEYAELERLKIPFTSNLDRTECTFELSAKGLAKENGVIIVIDKHKVRLHILRSYPYAGGLEVAWITPIFHPNIRAEDGRVCIQLLNEWAATQGLADVYAGLKQLLENPNPADPLDPVAAEYFRQHPDVLTREDVPQRRMPRVVS